MSKIPRLQKGGVLGVIPGARQSVSRWYLKKEFEC